MWIFTSSKLHLLLILILALLLPPAPEQVRVEWVSPSTARISWQHTSQGNYWALLKQVPWGHLTVAESFDAEPGHIVVEMGPRVNGQFDYSPAPGAHYLIQVAQRDAGSGATEWSEMHGPYTLGDWPAEWTLLPVVVLRR